jgi:hypothetical protein
MLERGPTRVSTSKPGSGAGASRLPHDGQNRSFGLTIAEHFGHGVRATLFGGRL